MLDQGIEKICSKIIQVVYLLADFLVWHRDSIDYESLRGKKHLNDETLGIKWLPELMLDQGVAIIFHMDNTRQYIYGKILAYNADIALVVGATVERSYN